MHSVQQWSSNPAVYAQCEHRKLTWGLHRSCNADDAFNQGSDLKELFQQQILGHSSIFVEHKSLVNQQVRYMLPVEQYVQTKS